MQYAYIYACVVYVWLGVIIRRGDEVLGRTMRRAVMDSLTHLFSSRRWPATRHTHSTAVNTQMDTTVPLLPPPVPPPTTTASDHHHHHAILAFPSLLLLLLSSRFFVSSSLSLLRVSLRWSGVTGDFGARRGASGTAVAHVACVSGWAGGVRWCHVYGYARHICWCWHAYFGIHARCATRRRVADLQCTFDRPLYTSETTRKCFTDSAFSFFFKNYGLCFRRRIFGSIGR